jgi:hypothetical protein
MECLSNLVLDFNQEKMCSSKHTKIPLSKQFLECGIFQRFLNFTNAYWIKMLFLIV